MVMLTPGSSQELHFRNLDIRISIEPLPTGDARVEIAVPDGFLDSGFDHRRWRQTSDQSLTEHQRSQHRHHLCNRLHIAGMSFDILRRHAEEGDASMKELESVLEMAVEALADLEESAVTEY